MRVAALSVILWVLVRDGRGPFNLKEYMMRNISWAKVEDAKTCYLLAQLKFELLSRRSAFNIAGCNEQLLDTFAQLFELEFMADVFDVANRLEARKSARTHP